MSEDKALFETKVKGHFDETEPMKYEIKQVFFKGAVALQYVTNEIHKQKKTILRNIGESPNILFLSSGAYEIVLQLAHERHNFGDALIPTEFMGMKIMVDGSAEGIYVRCMFDDAQKEFLYGKDIRRER